MYQNVYTILQVKPTRTEQKKQLRKVYRKCRNKNESLKQLVPTAVVVEDESIQLPAQAQSTAL